MELGMRNQALVFDVLLYCLGGKGLGDVSGSV